MLEYESVRRSLPYLVLLIETLVFFRLVLFVPGYVMPWDIRGFHYPQAWFLAESLRAWELPLWDPFTYLGRPFLANIQTASLYPPLTLLLLIRNAIGGDLFYFLELNVVLHVWLAGAFTYLLLKRLGLGAPAALLGATVYSLGGFFPAHVEHMGSVCGAAWMPLAWLAVLGLRDNLRWLPALAIALAMSVFAGHTPLTAVVFVSTLFFAVLLAAFRQARWRVVCLTAAGCVWAGLLAAVQLIPSIELSGLSIARYRSDWLKSGGGAPLQSLISLVMPNYYNLFDLSKYSFKWEITFMYLYCGVLGLALALAAVFLRKRKETALFTVMTVTALFAMLGDSTPVGRTIYNALPESIRIGLHPEFSMPWFILGMATLAALGAEMLFRVRPVAWGAVALAAFDLIYMGSGRPMNTTNTKQEPGVHHDSFYGDRAAPARMRELTRQTFPPARIDTVRSIQDWGMAAPMLEIPSANGNDPMALERAIQVRLAFCNGERWGAFYQVDHPDSPALNLANVRYLLSREPVKSERLREVARLGPDMVYENPQVMPRAFLAPRVRTAANLAEAAKIVRAPGFDPRAEAVVEGPAKLAGARASGTVKVVRYEPRTIVLEVDAAGPAFLVLADAHYPGWRAFMDGAEAPIYYADAAFRGVEVPKGNRQVLMRFAPRSFWYAGLLSAITWVAAAVALLRLRFRRNYSAGVYV